MKDESKARWPEGMKWQSPSAIIIDDETEVAYLPSEDLSGCNSDVGEMINRHRFAQIQHLPAMVALLKLVERLGSPLPCNVSLMATDILRKIGEVE